MQHIKSKRCLIGMLLAVTMLFQSCAVYSRDNTPIKNAVIDQTKVKVTNQNSEVVKYKKIQYEADSYVGITPSGERQVIDPENVKYIRSYDSTATVLSTLLAVAAVATTVLLSVVLISFSSAAQN